MIFEGSFNSTLPGTATDSWMDFSSPLVASSLAREAIVVLSAALKDSEVSLLLHPLVSTSAAMNAVIVFISFMFCVIDTESLIFP